MRHSPALAASTLLLALLHVAAVAQPATTAGAADSSSQSDATPVWVRSWGAALMAPEEFDYYPDLRRSFRAVTLRQVVVTTLGGRSLRVLISNQYGTRPLKVGEARVAQVATAARIVPGSDRPLRFGGAESVSIPAGAAVYSDPVDLGTAAHTKLALSLYLPESTAGSASTVHEEGWHAGFVSPRGDFAGAVSFPVAAQLHSDFYVGAVDVLATHPASAIVTLGDSITDGTGSTPGAGRTWPDDLARRLASERPGEFAVVNMGLGGNRLLHAETGPSALSRSERDAFTVPGARFVIVLEGINDIAGWPEHPEQDVTASDVIGALGQLVAGAHAHGLKAIGGTITPTEGCADCGGQKGETMRRNVNAWIRDSRVFDAVVDFDRIVRDPRNPARLAPAFDCGDHLHLSDAGYAAMANAVDLAEFSDK